jgi:release factor glutamine methyltransferase
MYFPKEDSFFLSEIVSGYLKKNKLKEFKALDMGTGSAIQAETLSKFTEKKNILCIDLDEEALNEAKRKGFKALKSNLFSKIRDKFEIITFNPPYLPEDKFDKEIDTSGGKKGDETILKFLKQSKSRLNKSGKIFLLLSNLTPRKRINQEIKKIKFKAEKLAEKSLFFEKLEIWLITN